MDSLVQALLIITVPLDLGILLGGAYLIKAYTHEQISIREAAHDAEITNREHIRLQTALAKNGQYEPEGSGGSDVIGQLIAAGAPLLMQKLQAQQQPGPMAPVTEEKHNGKV